MPKPALRICELIRRRALDKVVEDHDDEGDYRLKRMRAPGTLGGGRLHRAKDIGRHHDNLSQLEFAWAKLKRLVLALLI